MKWGYVFVVGLTALAVGCSGVQDEPKTGREKSREEAGKFFGDNALIFGGSKKAGEGEASPLGVNSYLWRASLDTASFLPLTTADPFGGVIISDWYSPPEAPGERFKVNIYILGRQLRADGIRASVFRQRRQGETWVDMPVDARTATDLENAILTRARQLRIETAGTP